MRHDDGTWLTLGLGVAATGLAALGRRGSANEGPVELTFDVSFDGEADLSMRVESVVPVKMMWDRDPATFPTREQVLAHFLAEQSKASPYGKNYTLEDAARWASREWVRENVLEHYTYQPDPLEAWQVEPQGFKVRTVLGGRRAVVRDTGGVIGYAGLGSKGWG